MRKEGWIMKLTKYDVVRGWFGTAVVMDISERDDLVGIKQGGWYRFVPKHDIVTNLTQEED